MDDIPRRIERSRVRDGTSYPAQCRYTFKHMEKDMWLGSYFIDNIDATFVQHDEAKLPSGLLLDYVFGAAAVKHWGAGLEDAFDKLGHKPFRPVHVLPPSSGRRRTVHEEDKLDAFDLVMIFWANTAAARQRREEEDAAFRSSISTWASDVDQTV
ncbi:hypothetical protein FISHEDRAFT_59530 [Fistulina hepatica ATCC 64428]|nr:hypothetical protein FISHEDRAFT_59530 [Fistulina hepatica ATCC 64428]